jgi:hypothetical protein
MAKPTLTPAQTTSVIVLPENYTVPGAGAEKDALISSFPFGIYANVDYWFDGNGDADETQVDTFLQGAADQVAYTYRKLGGDVLDIELTKEQVFAAYEEAVLEYSYILNIHQTKNTLSNSLGNSTGSFNEDGAITEDTVDNTVVNKKTHVSLKYPRFDFAYARRVTEGISEEVGVGGSTTVYSASIDITDGVQDYDIQAAITSDADWQAALGFTGASDANKILVKKVFYKT